MRNFGRNQATNNWIEEASTKADDVAGRVDEALDDTLEPKNAIRVINHAWAMTISNELGNCGEDVYLQDIQNWLEVKHKESSDPKYKMALEFARVWLYS
jgi:hypothetical protein